MRRAITKRFLPQMGWVLLGSVNMMQYGLQNNFGGGVWCLFVLCTSGLKFY